jgi:hypothetical protein
MNHIPKRTISLVDVHVIGLLVVAGYIDIRLEISVKVTDIDTERVAKVSDA